MTAPVCSAESHNALKSDESAWSQLPYVGVQVIEADETGPAEALELRNCRCHSTLCRPVPMPIVSRTLSHRIYGGSR